MRDKIKNNIESDLDDKNQSLCVINILVKPYNLPNVPIIISY